MIQRISLNRGQILTKDSIYSILNNARASYDYAKFTLFNRYYLVINFNRDRTIAISTNTRDIGIWRQIEFLRVSFTQERISEFVFNVINTLSKK